MSERLDRFVNLMKSVFELDKSDLDFGIYRVMNIRKQEIETFLSEGLPKKVQETLAPFAANTGDIEKRLAEIEQSLGTDISALPDTIPMAKEYRSLKSQLASGVDMSALESDVYSALYSFFNRYYDEGDFISKRRYKEGVYAIPYEGEEVKLYWANQDQYYIKTSENFKDYTFVAHNMFGDTCTVHFLLVDATTEQNNNKESDDSKRMFMLYEENDENPEIKTMEYREDTNEFIVRFVFDVPADKKFKYAEQNAAIRARIASDFPSINQILLADATTDKKKPKTLIDKHLEGYVAKNTFDYFIHKDLRGFLRRELDFYIKSEVIHLDDIDTADEKRADMYLAKVRAIKRVGGIIIDFLAQIEDFQKKLWLKKKFIIETNWCITLDRIDESFWSEIVGNKAQIAEWISMYAIDEVEPAIGTEGWTNPPTMEFLRQNQNLVVDTKHFSRDFKDRLIASIDNLDEQTDGLMINGDNYHALHELQNKYSGIIDNIYIDPPYNAGGSEILYKNTFKHSAWLSFIGGRIELSEKLRSSNGSMVVAIDENEQVNLGHYLNDNFREANNIDCITIIHNPGGIQGTNFSYCHEYAYFIYPKTSYYITKEKRKTDELTPFRDWGKENSKRTESPNCFFPIISKDNKVIGFGNIPSDGFHPSSANEIHGDEIWIWPIDVSGIERRWRFARDTVEGIAEELVVVETKGILNIQRAKQMYTRKTLWNDAKYSANVYGTQLLAQIFKSPFAFPKSLYLVKDCIQSCEQSKVETTLDYFAGSGTTGHAVINLNREDGGKRKYILVEMGNYFNTVTKPRMQKVIYSSDWKDGKPTSRNTGVSHIMKYFNLESYEDALSNIQLADDNQLSALFGEQYLIHYMLYTAAQGSLLDLEQFKAPFDYKLKVNENNETKEKVIDVAETFNYLIGLSVSRQSAVAYFRAESDANGGYDGAVRLIKDIDGDYAFKQIEGTLPDGRRALVIWRSITDDIIASNAALDAYFLKHRINPLDREYDIIYVNGDNNLENLKNTNEEWKVALTELEFKNRMFEEA